MVVAAPPEADTRPVGSLREAVDALADVDPAEWSDPLLADEIVALRHEMDRLEGVFARLVRAGHRRGVGSVDGIATTGAWLRHRARMREGDARTAIECGEVCELLPDTGRAWRSGVISTGEARTIIAARVRDHDAELIACEPELLALARQHDLRDLRRACAHFRNLACADGSRPRERDGLSVAQLADGRTMLTGEIGDLAAETVVTAIHAYTDPPDAEDFRTVQPRNAAALVRICEVALAHIDDPAVRRVRTHVSVVLDWTTLTEGKLGRVDGEFTGLQPATRVVRSTSHQSLEGRWGHGPSQLHTVLRSPPRHEPPAGLDGRVRRIGAPDHPTGRERVHLTALDAGARWAGVGSRGRRRWVEHVRLSSSETRPGGRSMRVRTKVAAGLVALTLVVGIAAVSPAGAVESRPQYPVPYLFSANIVAAALHPGTPPPGSNDWTCRPSAVHPRPVVLVHGLLANMTDNWQTMSPLLANNGYCVFALSYGVPAGTTAPSDQFGGLNPMEQSATELSAFVDRVLDATGAKKVDIVGHSEGATMPDYYIEYLGGAAKVARYVGVSGVKHGTTLHGVGTLVAQYATLFPGAPDPTTGSCASCAQFLVGSDYIKKIEARAPAAGVAYTNLATRYDELVSPHTSSFLAGPNVTNITVQDHCVLDASDHLSIISSPITGQYILNGLDPAHARPAPCVPVLPAL